MLSHIFLHLILNLENDYYFHSHKTNMGFQCVFNTCLNIDRRIFPINMLFYKHYIKKKIKWKNKIQFKSEKIVH